MSPFTPAGERARWRVIYDLLTGAKTGDTVTYGEMGAALGLDSEKDRHTIQMAVRRAAREHLKTDLRSLEAVPNQGYKIVEAVRKLELAKRHQGKARRQIRWGGEHVNYVDLSGMDETTVELFKTMVWKFAQQDDAIRKLDVRQQRMQRQVEAAVSAQQHTSEELSDLRARLERLEAERGE